jgi:hypothetical protein
MVPAIGTLWRMKTDKRLIRIETITVPVMAADDVWATVIVLNPRDKQRAKTSFALRRIIAEFDPVETLPSETLEILRRARTLVAAGWIKGDYAQDANHQRTPDDGPTARYFSADGAICRATYDLRRVFPGIGCPTAFDTLAIYFRPRGSSVTTWNDQCTTVKQVLRVFDLAIADLAHLIEPATATA